MVSSEIGYEESLETMNEEGLRRECMRLHEQLPNFSPACSPDEGLT